MAPGASLPLINFNGDKGMGSGPGRAHGYHARMVWGKVVLGAVTPMLAWAIPTETSAQRSAAAATSLVFEGVTVVDVEQGKLVPDQRVVITGNRIRAVGDVSKVQMPQGAQVVPASGKYLIPGLWDLHVHPRSYAPLLYPLLIASGITGIRDAASEVPLDTLLHWRRAILAGTKVGPPRQVLSGKSLDGPEPCEHSDAPYHICISDVAHVRHHVDSSKAAGVDMLKMYGLAPEMYFAVAAAARRIGLPFGGHANAVTVIEASDSGARLIDHVRFMTGWPTPEGQHVFDFCLSRQSASLEQCRPLAERLRRNGTWLVMDDYPGAFDMKAARNAFRNRGSLPTGNWLHDLARRTTDSVGFMRFVGQLDWPILAGTDLGGAFDFGPGIGGPQLVSSALGVHVVLAGYVLEGLTPLAALRSATLNPAQMLRGTDSLGTVAPGKLADLVLLDADPLADITNTTTIRAVVANGRYFDRAALDKLLTEVWPEAVTATAAQEKEEP